MKKILITALAIAVVGFTAVASASAFSGPKETVPGWGYGDQNHTHTGPVGLSVRPH